MAGKTLIKNGTVVTMNDAGDVHFGGSVLLDGDRIADVGPADEVAADVPLGRPRRRVRAAAFARAEAGTLRGRRGWIKPDIAGERWPDRTAGAAINPGGQHRGDKPAVKPSVLGLHGPIAAVEVFMHGSTITPDH